MSRRIHLINRLFYACANQILLLNSNNAVRSKAFFCTRGVCDEPAKTNNVKKIKTVQILNEPITSIYRFAEEDQPRTGNPELAKILQWLEYSVVKREM